MNLKQHIIDDGKIILKSGRKLIRTKGKIVLVKGKHILEEGKEKIEKLTQATVYSKLDTIPNGDASDNLTAGALILEGGAFRGVYSSGVCDALMLNDINMQTTIGVSAGSLNAINYCAGQIGRSGRINLTCRHKDEYIGLQAVKNNHGVIGFDFLFSEEKTGEPFNMQRLTDPRRRCVVVAANCNSGEAEYFEAGKCDDILTAVKASCSMPYVSEMVKINDQVYLDGGCAVHTPYAYALEQGYDKIIVVRTRERNYRKSEKKPKLSRIYTNFPKLKEKLEEGGMLYNKECEELLKLEQEGRIFVIAPNGPVEVSRLEGDMEKLGELYWRGYNDAINALPELKKYLAN